jgi:NAD(P)-dependent dehydrogenase (short-subunit alcohol dehydrogenase family)
VKDLGAGVNWLDTTHKGTALLVGAQEDHLHVVRCLVQEFGADVNLGWVSTGDTPVYMAARMGLVAMMRCLVKELGADVNRANKLQPAV